MGFLIFLNIFYFINIQKQIKEIMVNPKNQTAF